LANKNDQVFSVSLSEIAFTLVFILMLLLGFMILQERQAKELAEARLAKTRHVQTAEAATEAMQQARQQLTQALKESGVTNPTELVQTIVNTGEIAAERDRFRQEVLDLSKKLVALDELRSKIEQAGQIKDEDVTREQVEQAIELQKEVEKLITETGTMNSKIDDGAAQKHVDPKEVMERVKQAIAATNELRMQAKEKLGVDVKPGQEPKVVRDVVEGARIAAAASAGKNSVAAVNVENEKLRTQVAFYEKRDKLRGLDHPPCWMDKDSKIEYIFNVQTTQSGFVVTQGWPSHRESDARATPGFDVIMASSGSPMSADQFNRSAKRYLDYGKKQSPECRHFVYLSSTIVDADSRDNARRLVNSNFYINERNTPLKP
jgi:hypothetical protein